MTKTLGFLIPSCYWPLIGICIGLHALSIGTEMDGPRWPWRAIIHFVILCARFNSEPITNIWMKIDPYHKRRQCSADATETPVCDIRVMQICSWGFDGGGIKWMGLTKIAIFASRGRYIFRYIFRTFMMRPMSQYIGLVPQRLFIDIETARWPWIIEWPWIAMAIRWVFPLVY